MSKSYSLCGIRFGYAFAQKPLIETLDKCKDSYNVDMITQTLAAAALEDEDYLRETVRRVRTTRAVLTERLRRLGFEVIESQANFVLCRPLRHEAKKLYEYLASHRIYVRYFEEERLADKLRITVGSDEEIEILIEAIERYASAVDPSTEKNETRKFAGDPPSNFRA